VVAKLVGTIRYPTNKRSESIANAPVIAACVPVMLSSW
jgi:hypothetical protein